jgi:hypothetical protein
LQIFDISGSNPSINLGVANTLLVYGSTLDMSSVAYTGTLTVKTFPVMVFLS